jgi:PAS domain S-box-containing protein
LDNLGARHGYALGLIAVTTTLSFFMFWVALTTHDEGQDQLILLANQMARAERLALDTHHLVAVPPGVEREDTRRFMKATVEAMVEDHGAYVQSLEQPFRFGANSPEVIHDILFGPGDNLNVALRRFLELAGTLASTPDDALRPDLPLAADVVSEAREILVPRFDTLRDLHMDHLRQATGLANWIALFMWLALMALLVVETHLIFRPLARQVSSQLNDLRAAYEDLEMEKRKFEGTLAGLPDAVVVVNDKGIIAKINIATEALLGYSEEDLVGQAIEVLVPQGMRGDHRVSRADIGRKQVRRVMGRRRDITALRKDGTLLPVEINLNTVRLSGETVVIATIIDLSERIALEGNRLEELRSAATALTSAARNGRSEDLDRAEAKVQDLLAHLVNDDREHTAKT